MRYLLADAIDIVGQQVSHVWVDGVSRVLDYQLADDIDSVEIITRARNWQNRIQQDR